MPIYARCLLPLLFAVGAVAVDDLPLIPGRTVTITTASGGLPRIVLVHAPAGVGATPRALVLALHGGTGDARGTEGFTGFDAIADREGFIVAYPQGTAQAGRSGFYWNDDRAAGGGSGTSDDVGFVRELIDRLVAQGAVDAGRVFATGISNGAMMCHRLARELPDRLAAIAAVAGNLPVTSPPLPTAIPVSIAQFSGTDDTCMPFGGGEILSMGVPQHPSLGRVISADATVARWVAAVGARRIPVVDRRYGIARSDGCVVARYRYSAPSGAAVWFYRIEGGGHTWPGADTLVMRLLGRVCMDIDASEEIWRFFSTHGRAGAAN